MANEIVFALNGEVQRVRIGEDVDASWTLNQYIRQKTRFTGTKESCGEGGCGACVVALSRFDGEEVSVNSCLKPLVAAHGTSIVTTEGLSKDHDKGQLHPVQQRVCALNGTQCGFCTPGMVMTTYVARRTATQQGRGLAMAEMERKFDGNICRCTGYRPILDAAKSFCEDSDIEDLVGRGCAFASLPRGDYDHEAHDPPSVDTSAFPAPPSVLCSRLYPGMTWHTFTSLPDVLLAVKKYGSSASVVCGCTGWGVYKDEFPAPQRAYIDVRSVPELQTVIYANGRLSIGAAVTLSYLSDALSAPLYAKGLFPQLLHVISRVANVHVRNTGSVGGNIMLAKKNLFLSDLATFLIAADAIVTLASLSEDPDASDPVVTETIPLRQFISSDESADGRILVSISIPDGSARHLRFYKQAARPLNAHAIINAAFSAELSADGKGVTQFNSVFGGFSEHSPPTFGETLDIEVTRHPLTTASLPALLKALSYDIDVWASRSHAAESHAAGAHPSVPLLPKDNAKFRTGLVRNLFFKFYLHLLNSVGVTPPRFSNGSKDIEHLPSSGEQRFQFSDVHAPVSDGRVTKLSGPIQASGRALFVADQTLPPRVLHAAFVISTVANAKIVNIVSDPAKERFGEDFVSIYTHADIPGRNSYSPLDVAPVFPGGDVRVTHYGQPIAIVVATSVEIARMSAKLVHVEYEDVRPPILTFSSAREHKDECAITHEQLKNFIIPQDSIATSSDKETVQRDISSSPHHLSGVVTCHSQSHFYLENQSVLCWVDEGVLCARVASQGVGFLHSAMAAFLNRPMRDIRIEMRRAGGSFGAKISSVNCLALAAALASVKTSRPVRLTVTRDVDMQFVGGREEIEANYSVGFDDTGRVTGVVIHNDIDAGNTFDISFVAAHHSLESSDVYNFESHYIENTVYKTNKANRTAMRAPGCLSNMFIRETLIERIASTLGVSPLTVRERNLRGDAQYNTARALINQLKEKVDWESRVHSVDEFNGVHRLVKRGIALVPTYFAAGGMSYNAMVNVYADGSIIIHQSTAEIGQGSDTKVALCVTYKLRESLFGKEDDTQIDFAHVTVRYIDSDILENAQITGGSVGSERASLAAMECADRIATRMRPILDMLRDKVGGKVPWPQVCAVASAMSVQLSDVQRVGPLPSYSVYGAAVSEVEVDTLTGGVVPLFSHVILDCGKSLAPAIDVGQIEGSFVMGLGEVLYEKPAYSPSSGQMLTNGTWEYKPPLAGQVPRRFVVEMMENSPYDKGCLSSKATGEPPLLLAVSVASAVRHAINASRRDFHLAPCGDLPLPLTPDVIQIACGVDLEKLEDF